ncbi:MAG: helix-turn-helix transcriptional regulator [Candidatus Eremiobacteraeota bacterium]|nr:helix-turn-helix transcriptional regulator [Candidatus Eremiobacteraeota bacterium]
MLSAQAKLARRLKKCRSKKDWSQREVAAQAGFSQSYLAQVEKGSRPISGRYLNKLENIYGVKFGKLWAGVGKRGRPAHTAMTKRALREFGRAICEFWGRGVIQTPSHPQPHQEFRSDNPLWPMALHLGESAGAEVLELERLRQKDESFWRQFNSLRFDSWSEKRLLVRVGLLGGQLLGLRLDRLGCSLPLVDGTTGETCVLHRGYVLPGKDGSLVWCPQVAVATSAGVLCVDNLLMVSSRGQSVTVAVEVDGAEFHGDPQQQRARDRALGIPVLHVDAGELDKPGLVTRILQWAWDQPAA